MHTKSILSLLFVGSSAFAPAKPTSKQATLMAEPVAEETPAVTEEDEPAPAAPAYPTVNGWTADPAVFCAGLPGALAPVGNFDPFGLLEGKSVAEVKMLREAEVTHGRVSMLAVIGFLVQESGFHPLFNLGDKSIGPAILHLGEVRTQAPAFFEILTLLIGGAEVYRSFYGWTPPKKAGSIAPLGNLPEDTPLRRLEDAYYPGDIGFDPAGLKPSDPAEFAEIATKEIQNGRVAMLAIAGFVAQELVNGKGILENFS